MNRTSASVITLAIILSMVATPAFRSSSNRFSGNRPTSQQEAEKQLRSHSAKAASNQPQCDPINSFEAELLETISLAYPQDTKKNSGKETCIQDFKIPTTVGTQVMFALVPDPRHTNLALLFDRQMDALQQGIRDVRWTSDRALMPWDNNEPPQFGDLISTDLEEKVQDEKEKEPGLLIFRGPNGKRLLVFVIGENPIAGINKAQFQIASELVTHLFANNPPSVLGIFGPTFSGSLVSLSELLHCGDTFPCGSTHILDFSGTVTSEPDVEGFTARNASVVFASFEDYDDNTIDAFLTFVVNSRNYCPGQIAVLSEDESAYGTTGYKPKEVIEDHCPEDARGGKPLSIYFPREISHLRNAYQQTLSQAAAQTNTVPGTTLPLDLESRDSNDDTVPEYSHKQFPLSQEAVLLGIVSELRYHQVQLIILRATDSLDQFFLAHYLRGAYPGGRIVVLNADLLFHREIQDSALHGIMALSTYPLVPGGNQDFQSKNIYVDRVFPSSDSMGTYQASRLLTKALNETLKNPSKFNSSEICLLFTDEPFDCGRPGEIPAKTNFIAPNLPVHVAVLGHEGFAELAVLPITPNATNNGLQLTVHSDARPERILPKAWHLFWVMAVIVALAYCYFLLSASILSSSEAVAHLAPPQPDTRVWLFAVNSYLHFALLLTVLVPFFYFKVAGFEKSSLVVVMIIVCAAGIYDLCRRQSKWFAYALPGACLLTTVVLAVVLTTESHNSVFLFMQRSAHLTSGVSPLLPILLLLGAGLWGAWHSVSSSSLVDGRRPILPEGTYSDPAGGAQRLQHCDAILEDKELKKGSNGHLLSLLDADYVEGRAVIACIVIFAAVWWYGSFRPLQTLESANYEYLLAAIVSCIAALLLSGILRLQSLWTELRRLLVALDSLPLRRGFKRLEGFSWSPMWRVGAGSLSELRRLLSRQFESLRCLQNLDVPRLNDNFKKEFEKKAASVKIAYEGAKSSYHGYPLAAAVPAAGEVGVAAQSVGAGTAVRPALEQPTGDDGPDVKPSFLQSLLRRLKLSRWVNRVFGQGKRDRALIEKFGSVQQEFAKAATYALAFCETQWETATSIASNGEEEEGTTKIAAALQAQMRTPEEKAAAEKEEKRQNQLHACEEFVSLLYTSFILVVLVRIRGLIVAAGGMYVLLLAALNVYPFQPQVVIRTGLMILLVVIVGIVGFVYAQMHRDSTLSYITGTEPGELGLNFWVRIVSFVAVPAISLLASQFPQIAGLFSSWVEPAVNALK